MPKKLLLYSICLNPDKTNNQGADVVAKHYTMPFGVHINQSKKRESGYPVCGVKAVWSICYSELSCTQIVIFVTHANASMGQIISYLHFLYPFDMAKNRRWVLEKLDKCN